MNSNCNTQTRCKATSSLPGSLPDTGATLLSEAGAGARAWPFHPLSYRPSGISVRNTTHVKSLLLSAAWPWADSEGRLPCRGNGQKEAEIAFPEPLFAVGGPDLAR